MVQNIRLEYFFFKIRYWNISKIYICINNDIDYTDIYIYIYVFEEQKYIFRIILKLEWTKFLNRDSTFDIIW